jgi:hypothetical protein
MGEDEIASLTHCRTVLLRVIDGLKIEDLDYLIFPDSKSVGEIILHVAGFEYLVVGCAKFALGERPDHETWGRLRPGFAREGGFEPPRGHPLDDYTDLLAEVREETLGFLTRNENNRFVGADKLNMETFAAALSARYPEDDQTRYRRLAAGVTTSFRDDGAIDAMNRVDLFGLLQLHETYHRGQITYQKYAKSRILRRQMAS